MRCLAITLIKRRAGTAGKSKTRTGLFGQKPRIRFNAARNIKKLDQFRRFTNNLHKYAVSKLGLLLFFFDSPPTLNQASRYRPVSFKIGGSLFWSFFIVLVKAFSTAMLLSKWLYILLPRCLLHKKGPVLRFPIALRCRFRIQSSKMLYNRPKNR